MYLDELKGNFCYFLTLVSFQTSVHFVDNNYDENYSSWLKCSLNVIGQIYVVLRKLIAFPLKNKVFL